MNSFHVNHYPFIEPVITLNIAVEPYAVPYFGAYEIICMQRHKTIQRPPNERKIVAHTYVRMEVSKFYCGYRCDARLKNVVESTSKRHFLAFDSSSNHICMMHRVMEIDFNIQIEIRFFCSD